MSKQKAAKSNLSNLKFSKDLAISKANGTYTLVIFVPVEKDIEIGSLGVRKFSPGYYAYTGSAHGKGASSLRGRINRHLKKDKRKRWHIDYLLSRTDIAVAAVVAARTGTKMECKINRNLGNEFKANYPVPGFGSSDCKEDCRSHLLYLGLEENATRRIAEIYLEKTGTKVQIFGLC